VKDDLTSHETLTTQIVEKANMQATIHSRLRDNYSRWSSFLVVSQLITAVILLAFVFSANEFIYRTIHISPDAYKWLGVVLAILNFSLALINMSWRPASKARSHDRAVDHYSKFVIRFRDETNPSIEEVKACYENTCLLKIPERQFLRLKRWHKNKVALSKKIDEHPEYPLAYLKYKVWRENWKKHHQKEQQN
jgi:hypothetical protein